MSLGQAERRRHSIAVAVFLGSSGQPSSFGGEQWESEGGLPALVHGLHSRSSAWTHVNLLLEKQ